MMDTAGLTVLHPHSIPLGEVPPPPPGAIFGREELIEEIDKFCVLSLTHQNNGLITMLAPLRDYLGSRDPRTSPLLCAIRDHYSARLRL